MNTNETQDYEIPADWDVTVQAYYKRGYRAGIEAMRDAVLTIALRKVMGWFEKRRKNCIYDEDTYVMALSLSNTATAVEANKLLKEAEDDV